jgi:hypothetical protein
LARRITEIRIPATKTLAIKDSNDKVSTASIKLFQLPFQPNNAADELLDNPSSLLPVAVRWVTSTSYD